MKQILLFRMIALLFIIYYYIFFLEWYFLFIAYVYLSRDEWKGISFCRVVKIA